MAPSSILKQVIVVRGDLKLGKGKMAAQVAHASVTAADKSPWKKDWITQGQKKTVLKCSGEKELLILMEQARAQGLPTALIEDAGLTQIPSGTKTCIGIGPAPEEQVDKITGKLKLL
ncbi:MAG: peptidyl-tRNA hydrolase Pth2 [Candidatus Altiarchaeota archaeon]